MNIDEFLIKFEQGKTITTDAREVANVFGWNFPDTRLILLLEAETGSVSSARVLCGEIAKDWSVVYAKAFERPFIVELAYNDVIVRGESKSNPAHALAIASIKAFMKKEETV